MKFLILAIPLFSLILAGCTVSEACWTEGQVLKQCPENQMCAFVQENQIAKCVDNNICDTITCPEGTECTIATSFPVQVKCTPANPEVAGSVVLGGLCEINEDCQYITNAPYSNSECLNIKGLEMPDEGWQVDESIECECYEFKSESGATSLDGTKLCRVKP